MYTLKRIIFEQVVFLERRRFIDLFSKELDFFCVIVHYWRFSTLLKVSAIILKRQRRGFCDSY